MTTTASQVRCAVCSRSSARRRSSPTTDTFYGNACDGECHDLLLEAARLRDGGTVDEHADLVARWRARRTAADGGGVGDVRHGSQGNQ